jgi:hypothetical protein
MDLDLATLQAENSYLKLINFSLKKKQTCGFEDAVEKKYKLEINRLKMQLENEINHSDGQKRSNAELKEAFRTLEIKIEEQKNEIEKLKFMQTLKNNFTTAETDGTLSI